MMAPDGRCKTLDAGAELEADSQSIGHTEAGRHSIARGG